MNRLGPNHKDGCDGSIYRMSGEGYNRVRVCQCGAEDHDPDAESLRELRALAEAKAEELYQRFERMLRDSLTRFEEGDGA